MSVTAVAEESEQYCDYKTLASCAVMDVEIVDVKFGTFPSK